MARTKTKAITKEDIRKRTVKDMRELGVYKTQYDPLIDIFSDLMYQYQIANEEFEKGGRQYETETAAGGTKKSPIVATLEALRKDILAYSDRLCLNPKSLETVTTDNGKKKSALAAALSELG